MTWKSPWKSAVQLANDGFVIFPIEPGTKIAVVKWGTESTCNVECIESWWRTFPNDNIGINCGESGLMVVDLDSTEALGEFAILWLENEGLPLDSFTGAVVKTRRGYHLYFEQFGKDMLGNTSQKLGPGIDTRGAGGMVLAPGSVVKGVTYRLVSGDLNKLPSVPQWLDDLLRPRLRKITYEDKRRLAQMRWPKVAEAELRRHCRRIAGSPDGEQNSRINLAAYMMARYAMPPLDPEHVRAELLAAADRGNHPMSRAAATIESGLSKGFLEC